MKTTAKHTPGPWNVNYAALSVGCVNVKIGGAAKLFDVRGWGYLTGHGHGLGLSHDEGTAIQEANARLIAAAPDLLEALKMMLGIGPPSVHTDFAEMEKACLLALAAIEKAE